MKNNNKVHILLVLLLYALPIPIFASIDQSELKMNDYFCLSDECQAAYKIEDIKSLLHQHEDTLSADMISTVETILNCTNKTDVLLNQYLTLIDYSLPSNKKRFWVFDLLEKKLLFYTYVSHGLKSGTLQTNFFSNKLNSKATSLGVFNTGESYYGRHGISLKLQGIDNYFNNNANQRDLVLHSAWYVDEEFIKKYGRTGRSWGCPAIPENLVDSVIKTIKDKSLLVVYYPSNQWLSKSKYLSCDTPSLLKSVRSEITPNLPNDEPISPVLFSNIHRNNKFDTNDFVVVMTADNYQRIFKTPVPLNRMLRRQINQTEYIALNLEELRLLDTDNKKVIDDQQENGLRVLDFVTPVLIKIGATYGTEFKSVNLGKPVEISLTENDPVLITSKSRITLKTTSKFIRWLGL